jgi:tetratricopeptide (TPR) repeat protein
MLTAVLSTSESVMLKNIRANKTPDIRRDNIELALNNLWLSINQRNVPLAQASCQEFNHLYPDNPDGWYATSFLALQLKQFNLALSLIDKAIHIQATNLEWPLHKINVLLAMQDKSSAIVLSKTLENHSVNDIKCCSDLAVMFTKLANYQQASSYYQQAIKLINSQKYPKESAQLYFNLASIERYQGNLIDSEKHLNDAISLNPFDYEAYLLRSSLTKQTIAKNHIAELKQCLNKVIDKPIGQCQVHYALAKELEDCQSYKESFKQLSMGAALRRSHMQYNIEQDIATLKQITTTFNGKFFTNTNTASTSTNNQAIFILGLPRTGSTLVERIISNHDEVFSAGELNNFALCMMAQTKKNYPIAPTTKAALIKRTSQLDFEQLGKSYLHSTRPETEKHNYFVDKLPLNSLYVGLIHKALPKAKIIHVTRHPLDTCYAIYKQLFTEGYPFSYDLMELGKYYIAHHNMMKHWQAVLPGVIHTIAYEDVTNNLAGEAQKLLAYCQLNWQDQCINFEANNSPSTTASASQVRQKVYKTSNGKWRRYEKQLTPLKKLLEQAGICCD